MGYYDNYLEHGERTWKKHKYLYKKQVNGKTRYYYDVGEANFRMGTNDVGKDGQRLDSNIRGYTKIQDMLGYDERDRRDRAAGRHNLNVETYRNQQKMTADERDRKDIKLEDSYDKMTKSGQEAIDAIKAYNKTPLGKVDSTKQTFDYLKDSLKKKLKDIFK